MLEFKSIINSIKNLNWKKYFYKNLLVCFCVLFCLFFIVVAVIGNGYRQSVENEMNRYFYEISANISTNVEKLADTIVKSQNELIGDTDYGLLMNSSDTNSESFIETAEKILQSIRAYRKTNYIDSIYIYSPKSDYIISGNTNLVTSNYREFFSDSGWIDEYEKTKCRMIKRNVRLVKNDREYVTLIFSYNMGEAQGLAAYNIDVGEFKKDINENVIDLQILIDDKKAFEICGEKYAYSEPDKNNIETSVISVPGTNYKLCVDIDSTYYKMQKRRILYIILAMTFLVVLIAGFQAFWLVMKYYDNLLDLVLAMDGDDKNISRHKHLKEFAFVKSKILSMMDKNKKVETELAKRVDIMNKTKMAALQSQINPHFLYNTLNLISVMDMRENKKDTDTVRAISALSDILRYAMDSKSYIVPLSDEVENLKRYLYIQSLKYKDRFDVELDFAPETLKYKVLKMTIQPLMENSVFHGVLPSNRKCLIKLQSFTENNMLKIRVSDNGTGIGSETLKKLRENVNEEAFNKAHTHGLLSVNQRCMLLFGEEYGCEISSDNGVTEITVSYPLIMDEE